MTLYAGVEATILMVSASVPLQYTSPVLDLEVSATVMVSESVPLHYTSPVVDLMLAVYLIATVTKLSATLDLTTVQWRPSK